MTINQIDDEYDPAAQASTLQDMFPDCDTDLSARNYRRGWDLAFGPKPPETLRDGRTSTPILDEIGHLVGIRITETMTAEDALKKWPNLQLGPETQGDPRDFCSEHGPTIPGRFFPCSCFYEYD